MPGVLVFVSDKDSEEPDALTETILIVGGVYRLANGQVDFIG